MKRLLTPLISPFLYQSQEAGSWPILFAATADSAQGAGYYAPGKLGEMKGPPVAARIPAAAKDELVARKLWDVSEELVGLQYL